MCLFVFVLSNLVVPQAGGGLQDPEYSEFCGKACRSQDDRGERSQLVTLLLCDCRGPLSWLLQDNSWQRGRMVHSKSALKLKLPTFRSRSGEGQVGVRKVRDGSFDLSKIINFVFTTTHPPHKLFSWLLRGHPVPCTLDFQKCMPMENSFTEFLGEVQALQKCVKLKRRIGRF